MIFTLNSKNNWEIYNNKPDIEKINLLLGEMGLQILESINQGANNSLSIKMLSGVPIECIIGRLPVLIQLGLIKCKINKSDNYEYFITKNGKDFLIQIN